MGTFRRLPENRRTRSDSWRPRPTSSGGFGPVLAVSNGLRRLGLRIGHFLREIVPNRAEVIQFRGRAQLRRPRRNETKAPIMSQGSGNHPGAGGPGRSGRLADPEHRGTALAAVATSGRPAVLHRHWLAILDLAALPTLHAVSGHWNRPLVSNISDSRRDSEETSESFSERGMSKIRLHDFNSQASGSRRTRLSSQLGRF